MLIQFKLDIQGCWVSRQKNGVLSDSTHEQATWDECGATYTSCWAWIQDTFFILVSIKSGVPLGPMCQKWARNAI